MKKQAVLCELEQIEYHQDGGVAKEKDSQWRVAVEKQSIQQLRE
jgi:hypothetical protein